MGTLKLIFLVLLLNSYAAFGWLSTEPGCDAYDDYRCYDYKVHKDGFYCKHEWMKNNCKYECGICKRVAGCDDEDHELCPEFENATALYCEQEWMQTHCKYTCGICKKGQSKNDTVSPPTSFPTVPSSTRNRHRKPLTKRRLIYLLDKRSRATTLPPHREIDSPMSSKSTPSVSSPLNTTPGTSTSRFKTTHDASTAPRKTTPASPPSTTVTHRHKTANTFPLAVDIHIRGNERILIRKDNEEEQLIEGKEILRVVRRINFTSLPNRPTDYTETNTATQSTFSTDSTPVEGTSEYSPTTSTSERIDATVTRGTVLTGTQSTVTVGTDVPGQKTDGKDPTKTINHSAPVKKRENRKDHFILSSSFAHSSKNVRKWRKLKMSPELYRLKHLMDGLKKEVSILTKRVNKMNRTLHKRNLLIWQLEILKETLMTMEK